MRNKFFIAVFLVTLAFAIFSQSDFSRFLLGFEFLMEIALYVCARVLSHYVDKAMHPPVHEAAREQEIPLEVRLENRCGFPVSEVRAELKCRDVFSGGMQRLRGTAMLDGRDETTLRFVVRAQHYGLLTVWPEKICIGDPLGINFAESLFPKQLWEIAVLPELVEIQEQQMVPDAAKQALEAGETASVMGDDPSSAYELRAYQTGEPLRNVHWKMTAKTDEMMVKEFGKETEPMALVFLDLDCGSRPYTRRDWDAFLEVVASFAAVQLHAENHFEMFWLDAQAQHCHVQVRNESDAKAALVALLHEKPRSGTADETAYKEKMIHEAYNAVVRINLWGEITREETTR